MSSVTVTSMMVHFLFFKSQSTMSGLLCSTFLGVDTEISHQITLFFSFGNFWGFIDDFLMTHNLMVHDSGYHVLTDVQIQNRA